MKIVVPTESHADERRIALVPESIKKLVKAGVTVAVEAGAGQQSHFNDDALRDAGAEIESDPGALLGSADFLFKVRPPTEGEIAALREGAKLLTTLRPLANVELVQRLAAARITAFSTDAIPRTTRAQSMDTLSAMANIAGYKAAIIAADTNAKYFPMFMTAAGTIFPAKVFVIGAGVAGLQAIATAKRLGATVTATDTRIAVKEQVESLGAKFVGVEMAEDAETKGGYAKELSQEFHRRQAELIAEQCRASDAVITTALIGGYKAPELITREMVEAMQPGSVIVDLAAEGGGNCALAEPGELVNHHGVKIIAPLNLPAEMPIHGSTLYSRNLTNFFLAFWQDNDFQLNLEDEIQAGALITHDGAIKNERVQQLVAEQGSDA
jgi:H+-translocating NAD(P) transhydrogenase subunit alpha